MDEWFERSPFVGFVPWIIYWVVADGPSTWMFGAICAVLATLILGVSAGFAGVRLLDIVTVVFFTGVTVAGLFLGAHDRDWMDDYATALSSGVLAAMALGSLAFEPFTAQYAPASAPRQEWEEFAFRRTNQVLTLMWALVFALIAVLGYVVCHLAVDGALDQGGHPRRGDRRRVRHDPGLSETGPRQGSPRSRVAPFSSGTPPPLPPAAAPVAGSRTAPPRRR